MYTFFLLENFFLDKYLPFAYRKITSLPILNAFRLESLPIANASMSAYLSVVYQSILVVCQDLQSFDPTVLLHSSLRHNAIILIWTITIVLKRNGWADFRIFHLLKSSIEIKQQDYEIYQKMSQLLIFSQHQIESDQQYA